MSASVTAASSLRGGGAVAGAFGAGAAFAFDEVPSAGTGLAFFARADAGLAFLAGASCFMLNGVMFLETTSRSGARLASQTSILSPPHPPSSDSQAVQDVDLVQQRFPQR